MKRKPKQKKPDDNYPATQELVHEPMPIAENKILTPPTLQDIRTHMSNQRASTVQTIADLETWRAEIDATIAFLRGDKVTS